MAYVQQGSHEEVEFQQRLAQIAREVEEVQTRTIATLDPKHAEYVSSSNVISSLAQQVKGLRGHLGSLSQTTISMEGFQSEIDQLMAAVATMTTMLEVQQRFGEFDQMLCSAQYCDAAQIAIDIATSMEGITPSTLSLEPAIVKAMKMGYYQRRAILTAHLEDSLCQLCEFGDCSATARQAVLGGAGREEAKSCKALTPTTLQQVWEALQSLGIRERRLEQLSERACHNLVLPLLEAAKHLPKGRQIRPRIYAPTPGTSVWTWEDAPDAAPETENRPPNVPMLPVKEKTFKSTWRPPVDVVVSALESLLVWAFPNWAGSVSEVYTLLGKQLWPAVTQNLLQHFETCDKDAGEVLERFELAMFSKGFIDDKEKTLSRHAHCHRHALGPQRRASLLSEARSWLMKSDLSLVEVSDEDEPACITQMLLHTGRAPQQRNHISSGITVTPQTKSNSVQQKLGHMSTEDEGLVRLPKMHVSASVHRLVQRIRSFMEQAVAEAEQGRHEVAADLSKLAQELCTLFAVLRPFSHRAQLQEDPQICAIFLADCFYMVHVLLLMPHIYLSRLARDQHNLVMFVDLVSQLRRLGENYFKSMIQKQKAKLTAMLEPCAFAGGLIKRGGFLAAGQALSSAMQELNAIAQGLSVALPAQQLRRAVGLVLGIFCQDLLSKIFRLTHAALEEISCMSMLLKSAVSSGRKAYSSAVSADAASTHHSHLEDYMADEVPGWHALLLVTELLGSSLPRFFEKRAALLEVLQKDQVLTLLRLSLPGDGVSPQEAWAALCGSSTC